MTVVMTATFAERAKRVKFGVAVPPEMKDPTTIPMPVTIGIEPSPNTSTRPPALLVAVTIEYVPRIAIRGTEMKETTSIAFIPK